MGQAGRQAHRHRPEIDRGNERQTAIQRQTEKKRGWGRQAGRHADRQARDQTEGQSKRDREILISNINLNYVSFCL